MCVGVIMKLIKAFLIVFLTTQSLVTYSALVNDQAGFFYFFESKLKNKTFVELHPCNYSSTYQDLLESFEVHCNESGNFCSTFITSSEKDYEKTVYSCNETEQIIQSSSGDVDYYTKEEFELTNGNYVKTFLMQADEMIGHLADLTITKYKPGKMTIGHLSGNSRQIDVINVFGSINFLEVDHSEKFIISVSPDVPGNMQVLRFRVSNTNLFRYTEYK
jgi:hypothetical protein